MKIRTILPRILNDQLLCAIIIAGDELVMSEPAHLAGVIRFVISFFGDDRKACRDHRLDQLNIAAITIQRVELRIVVDEVHQFVRHHVLIGEAAVHETFRRIVLAGFDHFDNIVSVARPVPEFQRHIQIGRAA